MVKGRDGGGWHLLSHELTEFHFTYLTTISMTGMPDMSMREVRKVKLRPLLRRVMPVTASGPGGVRLQAVIAPIVRRRASKGIPGRRGGPEQGLGLIG